MRTRIPILLLSVVFGLSGSFFMPLSAEQTETPLPEMTGRIQPKELNESSGLSQSFLVPGRYWSHNDSGGQPLLYPLDVNGNLLGGPVSVTGARNIDWEAICVDGTGRLWIADTGNNANKRQDLKIYQVLEPGKELPEALAVQRTLHFKFPDQKAFPPKALNFDCEALFFWNEKLYVLSKHRADIRTKLYRIEDLKTEKLQTATLVGEREIGDMVTDAAMHPEGKWLAVLTTAGVWLFETPAEGDAFLTQPGKHFLFEDWSWLQIEGMTWIDARHLMICNEQRFIFRLNIQAAGWQSFQASEAAE